MGWFKKKQEYNWNEQPLSTEVIEKAIVAPTPPSVPKREPTALEILMEMRERIAKLEANQSGQGQATATSNAKKGLSDEEKEQLMVEAVKDAIEYLDGADLKLDEDMKRIVAGRLYQHFKKK